jgi:phenylpyruvate tautomerase PptA (4-oxalocrotonate tautomerase family)
MPLTLIITEGLLPADQEAPTMASLAEAFMQLHGLSDNTFMKPNVIGHVQRLPVGSTYSGLQPSAVAIVEWLTPSFAFTDPEVQKAYIHRATEIIHRACGEKHPRDKIWVNLTHAVNGMWGIGGRAYTNDALRQAIEQ